jgi:hypothetical protein
MIASMTLTAPCDRRGGFSVKQLFHNKNNRLLCSNRLPKNAKSPINGYFFYRPPTPATPSAATAASHRAALGGNLMIFSL